MVIRFKQKCVRCKKNYVLVTKRSRQPRICFDCQKRELEGEVKDPEMKKLFDIPMDFYKQNTFLRNIKVNYLRYGNLTENKINAFKKTVEEMTNGEM